MVKKEKTPLRRAGRGLEFGLFGRKGKSACGRLGKLLALFVPTFHGKGTFGSLPGGQFVI